MINLRLTRRDMHRDICRKRGRHRSYTLHDCRASHRETGVPVLFGIFRHRCDSPDKETAWQSAPPPETRVKQDGMPDGRLQLATAPEDDRVGMQRGSMRRTPSGS